MKKASRILALLLIFAMLAVPMAYAAEDEDPSLRVKQALPIVPEGTEKTLKLYINMDVTSGAPEDTWMYKFITEVMNINIDVTKFTNENKAEFLATTFASGELPDIIIGGGFSSEDLTKYGASEGMLMDLAPYVNETYMPNLSKIYEQYPAYKSAIMDANGSIWSVGFILDPANYEMVDRVFYNYDKLDEAGQDIPETLDEFLETMRAMKAADPESYPVGGSYAYDNPEEFILNALGFLNADKDGDGKPLDICVKDGKVTLPVVEEEAYTKFLSFMKTLYEEELINPDFFTMDKAMTEAVITEGKNVFLAGCNDIAPLSFTDNYTAYWGGLPLTSEMNATPQWPIGVNAVSCGGAVVSADTEEIETIVKFLDWFYTFAGYRMSNAGCYMNMYPEYALGYGGWTFSVENGVQYPDFINNPDKWSSTGEYRMKEVILWNGHIGCYIYDGTQGEIHPNEYWHPDPALYADVDGEDTLHDYDAVRFCPDITGNGNKECFIGIKSTLCNYLTDEVFPGTVYFDADTAEEALDLSSAINEYVEIESAKFITGAKSLDELPNFFKTVKDLGADDLIKLYADYYEAVK